MTYAEKMERLRELGDMQAEMAEKARHYAANDNPELALRFQRASYAAVNARTFMQAALMAEREANALEKAMCEIPIFENRPIDPERYRK